MNGQKVKISQYACVCFLQPQYYIQRIARPEIGRELDLITVVYAKQVQPRERQGILEYM